MSTTAADTAVRITLPQSILSKYEHRAKQLGRTLEQEIESRLKQFEDVESTKPLIISDQDRQKLERLMAKNFNDSQTLVASMTRAVSVQVGKFTIPLSLRLLDRLQSRCMGMPFEKFITQTIIRLLEEFVGLR